MVWTRAIVVAGVRSGWILVYIAQVVLTGFADGLDTGYEKKKELRMTPRCLA